ncbi:hypothetical protein HZC30_08125 [Candidatus Woesearchaeota archaeon]|nr:hypothetical protein [Candidatus Woesearchaeota archaeon]
MLFVFSAIKIGVFVPFVPVIMAVLSEEISVLAVILLLFMIVIVKEYEVVK